MPAILNYVLLDDVNTLSATLAQYTCPTDGYIHAWQDSYNPLLVWFVPLCPIDAVLPVLQAVITASITPRVQFTSPALEPLAFIQSVIAGVISDALKFLNEHESPSIAAFLSEQSRLHTLIFNELVLQTVIAT